MDPYDGGHFSQVQQILAEYDLAPDRVHTHIGSGSDPSVWQKVAGMSLSLVEQLPSVSSLNLGGGYKVGRMGDETSCALSVVGVPVAKAFEDFAARTGRKVRDVTGLSISASCTYDGGRSSAAQPGDRAWHLHAGQLRRTGGDGAGARSRFAYDLGKFDLWTAGTFHMQDKINTGPGGFDFVKLDSGMTEVLRPSMYATRSHLTKSSRGAAGPLVS